MNAGDVDAYGASDQARRGMRRVDRMRHGPPINQKCTWHFKSVIMAEMLRCGSHLNRPIAIQGATSEAFYNNHLRGIIQAVNQDRTAMT